VRGLERLFSTDLSDFAHDVRFAPGGAELVAATLSGDVVLLDAQTGEPRWARAGVHAGGALSASFSPDGAVVASGGQDGRVCFFDARSGEELRRVIAGAEDAWVSRVEWREGSVLAAAAGRGVRFFSKEGEARGEVAGLPSTVAALAWHAPSSTWLAAHYGGVALLDEGAPKPKRRLAYRGAIVTLGASPNGRFVATGNQDSTVRFWDLEAGEDASLTG
jgi:WD40 repeat protein